MLRIWCQRKELPMKQKQQIQCELSCQERGGWQGALTMVAEWMVRSKLTVLLRFILQQLMKLWVPSKCLMATPIASRSRHPLAKKYLYLREVHQQRALKSGWTCSQPTMRMSYGSKLLSILQYSIGLTGIFSFYVTLGSLVRRLSAITLPMAETPLSVRPARVKEGSAGQAWGIKLIACITLKMYSSTELSLGFWHDMPSQFAPMQHTFKAYFLTLNLSNSRFILASFDPFKIFCLQGSCSASLPFSRLFSASSLTASLHSCS